MANKFNPLKTGAILFTWKHFENFQNLLFDDTQIQFIGNHRHFGLTCSKNGMWHSHTDSILSIAAQIIGIMRTRTFTFNRHALN